MKIKHKFSSAVFFTGLLVIGLLSIINYFFCIKAAEKKYIESNHKIASIIASHVNHCLIDRARIAKVMANTPLITSFLEKSNNEFDLMGQSQRQNELDYLNSTWGRLDDLSNPFIKKYLDNSAADYFKSHQKIFKNEYGEIFLTNKYGALTASTEKLTTFTHAHKYWWKKAYNNGRGAVFFDDRGYDESARDYVLGVVVPVYKNNEVLGILKFNLNISTFLEEIVLSLKDKYSGSIKIVRSSGLILYEKGVKPFSSRIKDSVAEKIKKNKSGAFIIESLDKDVLFGYSAVDLTYFSVEVMGFGGIRQSIDHKKGNEKESWVVIYTIPKKIFSTMIFKTASFMFFIGIAFITAVALFSGYIGKIMASPIIRMSKTAEDIASGNFNTRIDIRSKDEVGDFAKSFNYMMDRLQETTASKNDLEHEINERKKAQSKAIENEKRFRRLFETIPDPVYVHDIKGRFYDFNDAACEKLGYTRKEMSVLSSLSIDIDHRSEDVVENISSALKSGAVVVESRHRAKSGRVIQVELHINTFMEGEKIIFVTVARDITERKNSDKEKSELISELQQALDKVKTLSGLLPICSHCKKIRNEIGYWDKIESYISKHSNAEFTHSICEECMKKYYSDLL
ncbi:MAG: PAS domain S-box protein [Desulfobacteraceae bacterium]|nr:PAS domain S-box protein [Desulfobacteraceae bacterium]